MKKVSLQGLLKKKIQFFYTLEAGKKVISFRKVSLVCIPLLSLVLLIAALFHNPYDSSFLNTSASRFKIGRLKTDSTFSSPDQTSGAHSNDSSYSPLGGIVDQDPHTRPRPLRRSKRVRTPSLPPLKYMAQQVILRDEPQPRGFLPTGIHFEGKLLSSIDTRNPHSWVKVLLYKGAQFKDRGRLPKDTILMGSLSYPGKGKKIFIQFNTGILPNGHEFSLQGEALDPKSFRARKC